MKNVIVVDRKSRWNCMTGIIVRVINNTFYIKLDSGVLGHFTRKFTSSQIRER